MTITASADELKSEKIELLHGTRWKNGQVKSEKRFHYVGEKMMATRESYESIGTSSPVFISANGASEPIRVGADYFAVRICGAQVAFEGSLWTRTRSVLVSTQVNLHHTMLGERGLRSLQQLRAVRQGVDEQLGLAVNLIALTPAVMPQVTISIDFHLDKENRIAQLGALVNKESFAAVLSLAPGSAAIAKTIGALADDVIKTFIPAEQQEPVLQFTGDFNLVAGGLSPGYYVILGSRNADHPLPPSSASLSVKDSRLLDNGRPVSGLSYVIIEVTKAPARSRDLGAGTEWDTRLREAEDIAQQLLDDPLNDNDARRDAWTKCRTLIKEAQTFLRAEPNYLRVEAEMIVRAAYLRCRELVTDPVSERRFVMERSDEPVWEPDRKADFAYLGLGGDETLEGDVLAYTQDVMAGQKALAGWVREA